MYTSAFIHKSADCMRGWEQKKNKGKTITNTSSSSLDFKNEMLQKQIQNQFNKTNSNNNILWTITIKHIQLWEVKRKIEEWKQYKLLHQMKVVYICISGKANWLKLN